VSEAGGDGAPLPLDGVRVVDLSQNLAGPFATQILGDLGADVVKVEPPGGDPARAWGPPFVDGESPLFLCANRNKRSVVLDLEREEERRVLAALASGADVFVQAFRSGVIERLGFDEARVRALREDVIYVSVTAYGDGGPLRDQPGYDPLMQAHGGLMSVTGHPGGAPARVGTSVVDLGTGLWVATAVLAALRTRDATGRGAHVTTSLLDTAVGWMAYHLQGHLASGDVPGLSGTGIGMIAPYEAFPTREGFVMIAAGNDATFRRLCAALGVPGLAADPRYATNPMRVERRDELVVALSARTREHAPDALLETLRDASVPCARIQNVGEVVRDVQVRASGMLRDAPASERWPRGSYVDVAAPPRWDGRRAPVRRPPPAVGEHTAEILSEVDPPDGPPP
jgi:crotonobetainyl-CoA:carnitine CoA-transferase CaiB-like acyl-CoA transferase